MKHPQIISFTAINLRPKELSSWKIYHMCLGKKSLSFQSTEESLGEHNFNTEDSKTVRVELEKNFDSTKKEIWNSGLKIFYFSSLFRYIIFLKFLYVFFPLLLLVYNKKTKKKLKKVFCTYQGFKKTFLLLCIYIKAVIVHICQSFCCT